VPQGVLYYLTLWPTGQSQPLVSTLNSWQGAVVANAAIVPAGTGGAVSVYVTNTTDVILDINGYFDSPSVGGSLSFYPAQPCRVADTRGAAGPFGGPSMTSDQSRSFAVPSSGCNIPSGASAYSMNVTVVPDGLLGYLTAWPTGQSQPNVSTLNSQQGKIVANAAIVPAGTNGAMSVFVTDPTDVVLDIDGYFGAPGNTGALSFYPVTPCRVVDTRSPGGPFGGPTLAAGATRSFAIPAGGCSIPSTAAAYSLNVTVVPDGSLPYLTAWPTGSPQPFVSTLNSGDGTVVANAAIVPAGANGAISVYAAGQTDVILDINGYFAPTVAVFLTTDPATSSQTQLMAAQPSVAFATGSGGSGSGNVIFVDETQTYQEVEGFGAAFTDSACWLLETVAPPSALPGVLNNLFTRNNGGIGLSFMRIPMGASDIALNDYSYDDLPAGQTDPTLANFSVAHDQAYIIPLILQAKALNPAMKLMANPWSPPGWMKTSGSMIGGSLLSTPSIYTAFANYFVKFAQAYSAAGISIDYFSLQNEPLIQPPPTNYPGMYMDAPTQTTILRDYVLPAFTSAGITPRVLVYDHNWDTPSYPTTVLTDPTIQASAQVAGTAWHGYGGAPGAQTTLQNEFPAKGNWETEHSGGTWITDQVKNDFEEITLVMRNWGKSYVKWSLALNENRGPNTGGCNTCSPLVTVNSQSGAITYYIDYYTLGHFSRFVLPGATRVYSSNGAGIVTAAFVNPDQSKVLVAFNDTGASQTFQVQWGAYSFTYALAALSGATFTWSGTQNGGYTVSAGTQIQVSSYNNSLGIETEITCDSTGGYDMGYSSGGSYAAYNNVDFGNGFSALSARVACDPANGGNCGGTLEFHLDSATGPLAGSVTIPATGGWQVWQTVQGTASASAVGLHDLYMVFNAPAGGTTSLGNVNWFQFSGSH